MARITRTDILRHYYGYLYADSQTQVMIEETLDCLLDGASQQATIARVSASTGASYGAVRVASEILGLKQAMKELR